MSSNEEEIHGCFLSFWHPLKFFLFLICISYTLLLTVITPNINYYSLKQPCCRELIQIELIIFHGIVKRVEMKFINDIFVKNNYN